MVASELDNHPLVMVVEDDEEMNELQRELLAIHGLRAVAAYDGENAMEVYEQSDADAVLLDIMLPRVDGFEFCRRLRKCQKRNLPIVMVTALDSDDCRRQGMEAGADAYFCKPFDPDEVIGTLIRLLSERSGNSGSSSSS